MFLGLKAGTRLMGSAKAPTEFEMAGNKEIRAIEMSYVLHP